MCFITYGLSCNFLFKIIWPNSFQTMFQSPFKASKRGQENPLFGIFMVIPLLYIISYLVERMYSENITLNSFEEEVAWSCAAILHPFLTNWQQSQACLILADSLGTLFTYVASCTKKTELTQSIQTKYSMCYFILMKKGNVKNPQSWKHTREGRHSLLITGVQSSRLLVVILFEHNCLYESANHMMQ